MDGEIIRKRVQKELDLEVMSEKIVTGLRETGIEIRTENVEAPSEEEGIIETIPPKETELRELKLRAL